MVEHSAVNRVVVGSSPTRGVFLYGTEISCSKLNIWLHGQAVKTSPFHGGNTGSIPVGVTYAGVAELADAQDLKSCGGDIVPVRFRSPACMGY